MNFLSMGGYAAFVWPAFAVTAIVMAVILIASLWRMRTNQRILTTLEAERRRARGAASGQATADDA